VWEIGGGPGRFLEKIFFGGAEALGAGGRSGKFISYYRMQLFGGLGHVFGKIFGAAVGCVSGLI